MVGGGEVKEETDTDQGETVGVGHVREGYRRRQRQRGWGGVRCLCIDGSKSVLASRQESTVIHAYCVNDQGFLNI